MRNNKAIYLTIAAMVAAIYAVLTMALWQFSSLEIQVRVSEALCVLPLFTPSAVPGLFIGCFLVNALMGNFIDAVFGGLATLVAAILTRQIRHLGGKKAVFLAPLPSVVLNAVVIPFVLYYGYGVTSFGNAEATIAVLGLLALSVGIGQAISCYGLGIPLYYLIRKLNSKLHFFNEKDGIQS